MNNGKVEQYATPQKSTPPGTPFVAEFVGQGNWLPFSRNSASHAQVGGMNMRLADNAGVAKSGRLFCRPEAISVNPPNMKTCSRPRSARSLLGNRCTRASSWTNCPAIRYLLAELAPEAMPRLGAQDIWVALPPRSLRVFTWEWPAI